MKGRGRAVRGEVETWHVGSTRGRKGILNAVFVYLQLHVSTLKSDLRRNYVCEKTKIHPWNKRQSPFL